MTTKSQAKFNVTPPVRKAIIELADAYATFTVLNNNPNWVKTNTIMDHAKRLREAQDAFGIELYPRHRLVAMETRKEAA